MISSFYSIATLISGLTMPFIGKMIDGKGHRKAAVAISFLFCLACVWMSMIASPWMIFLGFILIRLFGQGSMSLIPSVLIPQWFISKRGKALSLATLGGVLGFTILPPLNSFLIQSRGVSFAWLFWAAALLLIMMPVAYFLIRNRPEEMNLKPDGVKVDQRHADEPEQEEERSWTLDEAKRTKPFWYMLFCMIVPSLVNTGITFHMLSIVSEKGMDPTFGAYVLSITAMTQIPLVFLAGAILDKAKVHLVKGTNYLILGFAMVLLIVSQSAVGLIVYAVCHGLFIAFEGISTNVFWSNYYGRTHLGKIRGITMTIMVIGSALGPLPFGAAYDVFHGYSQILLILLILPVTASLLSFLSFPPIFEESFDTWEKTND